MIVLNWKDNKGYTLVELIISMAVFAVVLGAMTLLMSNGSKSYSNAKTELDLQMEAQTLMAQLNTMVMESNQAVYDDTNKILTLYQIQKKSYPISTAVGATPLPTAPAGVSPYPSPGADDKFLNVKMVKDKKFIKFDRTKHKLYLEEHDNDAVNPASSGSISYPQDELFADYIDDFSVTVDKNEVTVHLSMKCKQKTFNADTTMKIRNQMVTYP